MKHRTVLSGFLVLLFVLLITIVHSEQSNTPQPQAEKAGIISDVGWYNLFAVSFLKIEISLFLSFGMILYKKWSISVFIVMAVFVLVEKLYGIAYFWVYTKYAGLNTDPVDAGQIAMSNTVITDYFAVIVLITIVLFVSIKRDDILYFLKGSTE